MKYQEAEFAYNFMRCISPISIKDPRGSRGSIRLTVPCNKCGACQSNRRAQWSFRCAEELRNSTSASFITLTYQDSQIPFTNEGIPTLEKRHFQLFLKKLRQHGKIRYYAVGEYGSLTHRPHYHALIYNGGIDLNSHLQQSWTTRKKTPRGLIHCGSVTAASIHYVTKYHVNYKTQSEWETHGYNNQKEFALMSRNPGIGHQYKERAGYWNKKNQYNYLINNGFKQSLPRYYKQAVFNSAEKEQLAIQGIIDADISYKKEVLRLQNIGYKNPEYEIETRNYKKALAVQAKAQKEGKI